MWRKKRERDLERELRAHLELEGEEQGSADRARRALGNVALIQENTREAWGWMWLERLWQDLRYAARILRKSPGFTLVAVFSLALGIGANTALFSVVDAAMLKSLPVRDPGELRQMSWLAADNAEQPFHSYSGSTFHSSGGPPGGTSFSYPAYELLRDHVPQFSDTIGYAGAQVNVTGRGASEVAIGWFVSGNYFSGLGVRPFAGRLLQPADDAPGAPAVAVLSYQYWAERFALDPKVLGLQIAINRKAATVVGIAAPGFEGLEPGSKTDVFVPMTQVPELAPSWHSLGEPFTWWVQVFARMRPRVANAAAEGAAQAVLTAHVRDYAGPGYIGQRRAPLRIRLRAGGRGDGGLLDYAAGRIYVLDAIVGMVLLVACVNLAHLLLARSATRRRELAIRLSVGAGRARLIRQLLTESLLLAGLGGMAGLAVAQGLVDLLGRSVFGSSGVLIPDARVDTRALGFAFLIALLAAVLSGLFPAWRATRVDSGPSLKGASLLRNAFAVSRALIAAQVALSLLLLVGAGLFVRTLVQLTEVDLGFSPSHLLVFRTDASHSGYKGDRLAEAYARIREKIEAIPGVVSVGLSRNSLIAGQEFSDDVTLPADSPRPGQKLHVFFMPCSDSFLETMRIPLKLGRGFKDTDGNVVVVNETFVKNYFLPGTDPIGRSIAGNPEIEIVGVAQDAHYSSVRAAVPPTLYFPYAPDPDLGGMSYAIRIAVDPATVAPAVRRAVSEVDDSIPVDRLRTMQQQIDLSLGSEHTLAELVSAFGLAAAVLAAIGLYGVMAYAVARRTSEIGIRMALGANGRSVAWLVVRDSVWMIGAGLAVGIPAALALSGFVRGMLYGITPQDPWSILGAVALMATAGVMAAWIPARKASRVDPMTALRSD